MGKAVDLNLVVENVFTSENLSQLCTCFIEFLYFERRLAGMIEQSEAIAGLHHKNRAQAKRVMSKRKNKPVIINFLSNDDFARFFAFILHFKSKTFNVLFD